MPNPLRIDPTRSSTIRKAYIQDGKRRFKAIKKEIRKFLVEDDSYGMLRRHDRLATNVEREFEFLTDANKIKHFRTWLESKIEANVFEVKGDGKPWNQKYIESVYKKGVTRAFIDSKKKFPKAKSKAFYEGTKKQFLNSAFNAPETVSKIELLATRAFEQLRGVTGDMGQQMNRILANGITNGTHPLTIAKEMERSIDGLERKRARTIARTEVTYAHAEGQLDSFTRLGVEEVGLEAEWLTAGDDQVCALCADKEGVTYKIEEARGMIPLHPNCRCAWIPALQGL